jgi:hypothetical protein
MALSNASLWWLGICALPAAAIAQGSEPAPAVEIGFNYAYNSYATSDSTQSNQSGASVYAQRYFNFTRRNWSERARLGIVAEFSGSGSGSGSLYSYQFGPRWGTEWRKPHLVWYGQLTVGGAHVRVNDAALAGSGAAISRNSFAWGYASGLDLVVAKHFLVTLIHAESLFSQVPGSGHWGSDVRASAGGGFRFGYK